MFGKKCKKCGNKIKGEFDFCPFCGYNLSSNDDKENYGFLGKNDLVEESLFSGINDSFLDKMLNSAMKMLEKQMKNLQSEMMNPQNKESNPNLNNNLRVQFFVNGKRVFPNKISETPVINSKRSYNLSPEKLKKFASLPRTEPESKIRRISGKLIYEIHVPGVRSLDDILINQLENSIEIKALSDNKVYSKNLKINLPIVKYSLDHDFLILELQS